MAVEQLITQYLDLWTAAIKRRSTAGRGSSRKVELYGIKKLRELILELAVRGLLIPQDSKDEPASELLKKIATEKAKLMKAGKIRKEQPLPPIATEEMPFSLPKDWCWARLGEVTNYGFGDKAEAVHVNEDTWVPKILARYYRNNNLLFIGCSLHNDRTLQVFQATKAAAGDVRFPQHFAIEQAPEQKEMMVARNGELLRLGITAIWYPKGQHDCVEAILRHAKSELNYLKAQKSRGSSR